MLFMQEVSFFGAAIKYSGSLAFVKLFCRTSIVTWQNSFNSWENFKKNIEKDIANLI